ncbi:hypothetical protein AB840_04055 [Megasphaera cerevisiae DSM 20462]|uniref:Recombinase RecT n=1 Tax=Megasphaera cerevisiae DSM 20462 TaxID=1122219 RepID=A0A0J6ZQH8_9FIRM|nr:recombinase RecT [Megasphaera cerevisiae]KMO87211.1 hypothetical protein AB840_04055 [Megasphaera cerevisiae DSM 20462]SJZ60708.1 recombination protein RecT [Megasphaera cerevisiae DSM 20462]
MANVKGGVIVASKNHSAETNGTQKNIAALFNVMLSKDGYQKRFNELLGKRVPQFIGSLVAMMNGDSNLQHVFYDAPITIIQAALKAAAYDLPIDPGLGYAYIVPFKNKQKDGSSRYEATFIMGYKGMNQLALRSGAYKKINVIDVRDGELKSYNRLTEEIEFDFIEDDDEREKRAIIGYCGYFQLINGMEKTIYMTKKQIEQHEKKFRKGQYMGKVWREDYDSMACKTVFRKLIGKWGIMSVNYQTADSSTIAAATAIAQGQFDDEDLTPKQTIDMETGEVLPADHGDQPQSEDDKILEASLNL